MRGKELDEFCKILCGTVAKGKLSFDHLGKTWYTGQAAEQAGKWIEDEDFAKALLSNPQ